MKTVYMVTTGCYSDYGVQGIFSTRAKAEEYMAQCRASEACWNKDFNDITEWDVDGVLAETEYTRHSCGIMLDDGSVAEGPHVTQYWGIPGTNIQVAESVPCYKGRGIVRAESHKSAAHAMKLAVEARQKHLRETRGQR